ncbi:MAG: acyl carrier protein [Oligoflexia bacterium]|nr:acyl carrier protein [Oligoflexia bacterium]MBF0364474.1 acyl carrier protein [Oligoflexia bacterium]
MQEKIIQLVSEATKIDPSKITANTNFIEDLNLDSLDIVELMMKMEDEFGIEIPENEAENLKCIKDVVGYIESKKQ